MYNLAQFSLREMTECGAAVRKLGIGASSMEEVARRIVHYFHSEFLDPSTGKPVFALARFFKTHSFSELSNELKPLARAALATDVVFPEMKCLTLLGTAGDRPEWNARQLSTGHQVIPLPSEQMVSQAPMIAQLIQQLGLSIRSVVAPNPEMIVDLHERTYNVFHIPQAVDSPYIPAQAEFVQPYNVQSVLGFGGMLPSGNLMAIILFSKVPISRETAELFKPLALNTKMAVLAFDQGEVFAPVAA